MQTTQQKVNSILDTLSEDLGSSEMDLVNELVELLTNNN